MEDFNNEILEQFSSFIRLANNETFTEKEVEVLNCDSLSDEDKEKLGLELQVKYFQLKKKYPEWNIVEPDFKLGSLVALYIEYYDTVKTIEIYEYVIKLKYLFVMYLSLFGSVVDSQRNKEYTSENIRNAHKHDDFLLELSKSIYSSRRSKV